MPWKELPWRRSVWRETSLVAYSSHIPAIRRWRATVWQNARRTSRAAAQCARVQPGRCRFHKSFAGFQHQGFHFPYRLLETDKQSVRHDGMADIELGYAGDSRNRPNILIM